MSYRPLKGCLLFYVHPLSHPLSVCLWLFVQFIQYSLITICWKKSALLAFCFCCFDIMLSVLYLHWHFAIIKTYWPLIGPLHNLSSTNYPKSGLGQEISHTSKHNYSKESIELKTENINCIKSSVFRYKEDIVTPLVQTCYPTYSHIGLSQSTIQTNNIIIKSTN